MVRSHGATRRDDHSNDLIVHLLNQVSRLLNCDSAQHFKTDPYGCQMRDSIMEHLHLNQGLSPHWSSAD